MEQTNHLLMTSMGSAEIDRYSIASFAKFPEKFKRILKNFVFFSIFFMHSIFPMQFLFLKLYVWQSEWSECIILVEKFKNTEKL